jgi:hypothetical protein
MIKLIDILHEIKVVPAKQKTFDIQKLVSDLSVDPYKEFENAHINDIIIFPDNSVLNSLIPVDEDKENEALAGKYVIVKIDRKEDNVIVKDKNGDKYEIMIDDLLMDHDDLAGTEENW